MCRAQSEQFSIVNIDIIIGTQWADYAFYVASDFLSSINIHTVPRKSQNLLSETSRHLHPAELDPQVQVHNDRIKLLGSALANNEYLSNFFATKKPTNDRNAYALIKV